MFWLVVCVCRCLNCTSYTCLIVCVVNERNHMILKSRFVHADVRTRKFEHFIMNISVGRCCELSKHRRATEFLNLKRQLLFILDPKIKKLGIRFIIMKATLASLILFLQQEVALQSTLPRNKKF